ncbi:hypothetical protein QBC34DRAFT_385216 [Podospora aff. communis PSN243]|uniref:Uncharacterized protein n=1 Tax=Podospora aff. communis PSN243 TaxID=3040156 RepID=A0AAV9G8T6_9PEZI|nr:hypothetical protein QBC34DRAFT_385216 [Podospora aff. communis PSN243]
MPRELGGVADKTLLVQGVKGVGIVDVRSVPEFPGAGVRKTTYAFDGKAGG